MKGKPWTALECALVRERYPAHGAAGLTADLPGRSHLAIQRKAMELGVEFSRAEQSKAICERIPETLGQRLKNWRLRAGLKSNDAAAKCHLSHGAYSQVECGTRQGMTTTTLIAICRGTGLSADYLLMGD